MPSRRPNPSREQMEAEESGKKSAAGRRGGRYLVIAMAGALVLVSDEAGWSGDNVSLARLRADLEGCKQPRALFVERWRGTAC